MRCNDDRTSIEESKMKKILPSIFFILFVITGCGVETIFTEKWYVWVIAFVLLLLVAFIMGWEEK